MIVCNHAVAHKVLICISNIYYEVLQGTLSYPRSLVIETYHSKYPY